MQRDYRTYLRDILEPIRKIERYIANQSYADFAKDELVQDAVVRNLEVIGEAAKRIPDETKSKVPEVEWKKMAGLRDVLIHAYFAVDLEIVWDIVKHKIPDLKKTIMRLSKQ
jgi:uncharacterized protein with HEPN domain